VLAPLVMLMPRDLGDPGRRLDGQVGRLSGGARPAAGGDHGARVRNPSVLSGGDLHNAWAGDGSQVLRDTARVPERNPHIASFNNRRGVTPAARRLPSEQWTASAGLVRRWWKRGVSWWNPDASPCWTPEAGRRGR